MDNPRTDAYTRCKPEAESLSTRRCENNPTEYGDVFSDKPGQTSAAKITIDTENAKPVYLPPYRLPASRVKVVQEELRQLLQAGIIEKSDSPWAVPVVLVPKKDGTIRLCVNYTRLNKVTKPDPYPMPRIDELLDGLGAARFITMLDLTKGYWQVPVSPDSIPKNSFVTKMGKYQFKTMPFWLVGAPATFQCMMNSELADVQLFVATYMDD